MTYLEIANTLAAAGIENAREEAMMLLGHFCGVSRMDVLRDGADYTDAPGLDEAVKRRTSHYPLQYILGLWEFCHETYEVSEDTLIPRQDTEILVETAARVAPQGGRVLDLCTGSGCIAVSLLCMRPDLSGVGTDISDGALTVARRNAERNDVGDRVGFLRADVTKPEEISSLGRFDLVTANPPYIRSADLSGLADELRYEPIRALDGGEDGLTFYRAILANVSERLTADGILLLEIGYDQAKDVCALARENGFSTEVIRDLGGNDRVVLCKNESSGSV